MSKKIYKVTGTKQKRLEAPDNAQGYYRRGVSKDGSKITYTRVA